MLTTELRGRYQRAAVLHRSYSIIKAQSTVRFQLLGKGLHSLPFLPPPLFKIENTKAKSRHMDSPTYSVKLQLSYCALVLLSFNLIRKPLYYLKLLHFKTTIYPLILSDNKSSPSYNWLKYLYLRFVPA